MTGDADQTQNEFGSLQVGELDHVALRVSDLARSTHWYQEVLGLVRFHEAVWGDTPVFLMSGRSGIALFQASQVSHPLDPAHSRAPRIFNHCAWRVDADQFVKFQKRLSDLGIAVEFQDHRISQSIYFHDPDGHMLEITTYEVARIPVQIKPPG